MSIGYRTGDYSGKRGTNKPCPACKRPDTGRPVDGICYRCQREFAEYHQLQEEARKTEGIVEFAYPTRIHFNADYRTSGFGTIEVAGHTVSDWRAAPHERIGQDLHEILDQLEAPGTEHRSHFGSQEFEFEFRNEHDSRPWDKQSRMISKGIAPYLLDLMEAIKQHGKLQYEAGYQKGSSILQELAEGKLSYKDADKLFDIREQNRGDN